MRASLLALALVAACGDDGKPRPDAGPDASSDAAVDAGDAGGADAAREEWEGPVDVIVVDEEGTPVEGAYALSVGRAQEDWVLTDAQGRATVSVPADPFSQRWVAAGKRGWFSGATQLDDYVPPDGPVTIEMRPLPEEDNLEYEFQESGYPGHMEDASQCMHCHEDIGIGWDASAHRVAISNPHTLDLFNGTALSASEAECTRLGGRWLESGVLGSEKGELERHCVVDRGVLPDLNEGCGAPGETPCDHPALDRDAALSRFGSCGDCHGAGISRATPGAIDLNDAVGRWFRDGISCDFCHKVFEVVVGPDPGLDGAIRLRRPSEPSPIAMLDWAPINFGWYPDVINPFMAGSFNPQFRESSFCSGCHEHSQPALDPADASLVDAVRWPDGVPIQTTHSEWEASALGASMHCYQCHMPVLDLESSTFDITPTGLQASVATGWIRPNGEVRAHSWPGVAEFGPDGLRTEVSLEDGGGFVDATVTLRHVGAAHALPTGEPMRQVIVLLDAEIDGTPVAAVGGRAVPDVGGSLARGSVGTDVSVGGRTVTFTGAMLDGLDASRVRFVAPTGEWDDYDGPGVGWHSEPERTPEEKGLSVLEVLGEAAVESVAADAVTLSEDPPAAPDGSLAYLVGDGQHAGAAGWLYAKVLVDRDGNRGVHHYRAVDVASDNRIESGGSVSSTHRFPSPAPGSTLRVTARVVYRRLSDVVAREYGWEHVDIEIGTDDAELTP